MITNIRMLCFSVVLALSILAIDTGAVSGSPYVYQREGDGDEMTVTAEYETAYGTRESRFFGGGGFEQGLRLRFQPWSFVNMEACMFAESQPAFVKQGFRDVKHGVLGSGSGRLRVPPCSFSATSIAFLAFSRNLTVISFTREWSPLSRLRRTESLPLPSHVRAGTLC